LDRAEREADGLMWCGETIEFGGEIPIVVVCYVDPATPGDELTHIAARVRSAADRLAAATYPRNRRASESCDDDTECTSLVCIPGEQVPECSGDRCCVDRCIVDHFLCPGESICVPFEFLEWGFEYGPDDPPELEPWLEDGINAFSDAFDRIAASHGACVLPRPARG
jgi:hypothetical protein